MVARLSVVPNLSPTVLGTLSFLKTDLHTLGVVPAGVVSTPSLPSVHDAGGLQIIPDISSTSPQSAGLAEMFMSR